VSVAFRSSASVTNGTAGTTVVVSLPAGTITGDFLVAFVAQAGTAAVTAPTGWTLLGSQVASTTVTLGVYYKRASSEPGSWTWTLGSSLRNWGWVGAYTGVDPDVPITASVSNSYPSGGTAFGLSPAITRLRFGLGISAAAAVRAASGVATTWTSSGTERADLSTNAGAGTDIAGEVQDSQGSTDADTLYGPTMTASQTQAQAVSWGVTLNPYWQPPLPSATVSSTLEAAIGADLTADPATWVWTDLTSRAKGTVQITRGSADLSQETQPSKFAVRLDNTDGWLTPNHPSSPWYGLWDLGTPIRLKINQVISSFVRFQGRITQVDPVWPSGNSSIAFVDIECQGVLYALGQGEDLRSPLYRVISDDAPLWYWPMEDGSSAGSLAEASGGPPLRFVGGPPSIHSSGPAGTDGVVSLTSSSTLHAQVSMPASVTAWTVVFFSNIPSAPGISTPIWEWHTSGTVRRWRITIFPVGGVDNIGIEGFDHADTRIIDFETQFSLDGGVTEAYGVDLIHAVSARQNGGNINYEHQFSTPTQGTGHSGGSIAGTFGQMSRVDTPFAGNSGWDYGHLAIFTGTFDAATPSIMYAGYLDGSAGLAADTLITQMGTAAGVAVNLRRDGNIRGGISSMGPIPIASPLTIMRQAEAADVGILTDGLGPGLDYLPKGWRFNRAVELVLDTLRGQIKLPFEPSVNDQRLRDRVTVSRTGGSSATATDAALVKKRGVYTDTPTLNLADDSDLANEAGFRLREQSTTEIRAPVLTIDLRNTPELIRPWLERCDIGTRFSAANLPTQFGPDGLDQIIGQYVETIDAVTWTVQLLGFPSSPWSAFTIEDPVRGRGDTAGSTLAGGEAALPPGTVDTWSVTTTAGPIWTTTATYPGDFPFDVNCEGERITVTAITGTSSPQTFTVKRGTNGVVKAHLTGAPVSLWAPPGTAF
jgi:hypothetical protein